MSLMGVLALLWSDISDERRSKCRLSSMKDRLQQVLDVSRGAQAGAVAPLIAAVS
jgi:hypothetical protein